MYRENLLETHSLIDDDAGKSMSMRCVGIVGLEDRAKQVSEFTVETSNCGSGRTHVNLRSVPLVHVVGEEVGENVYNASDN